MKKSTSTIDSVVETIGYLLLIPALIVVGGTWGAVAVSVNTVKQARKSVSEKREDWRKRHAPRISQVVPDLGLAPEERKKRRLACLGKKRKTQWQEQSIWFRLPIEIRLLIYGEYFGGGEEVIVGFRKDALTACTGKVYIDEQDTSAYIERDQFWHHNARRFDLYRRVDVLPLLLTCTKIYSEAIPVLYADPIYTFTNPVSFLAFSASITPQHFHQLQNIYLDFFGFSPIFFDQKPGWPEPPGEIRQRRGCLRGSYFKPWDPVPILWRKMSYLHFRMSKIKNYYNPIAQRLDPAKETQPSFWEMSCIVLSQMDRLKDLRIRIPVWVEWKWCELRA
ncbi:hypothetical protein EJ04DRAFT_520810 [Polyplosphaeria fusca]|uniref:DUF7730 domain-containing protein n=1 Tax=Polyplosphaeria fusca TaxID=682080 RepID=A0A9P4R6J9_9PLEO|nr:hypothetical protein EJ04DRAFT_520810 [Polyplosphaeria fusca]